MRDIFGVDSALHGVAAHHHIGLAPAQGLTTRHAQLLLHQVHAGDHLSDRVLDLDAGVHLQKIKCLRVLVHDEFHGARVFIAKALGQAHGGIEDLLSQ